MWNKIIDKNLIIVNPNVSSKQELFDGMVDLVYKHDYVCNKKQFLKALYEREEMANTELIPGIALPHARTNAVTKLFVSIIILKNGINFENEEMGKAKIIFFFGCNESQNKEYLQLLAKSNRLLRNKGFAEKLLNCVNSDEVMELLNEFDDEIDIENDGHQRLMILSINDPNLTIDVMNAMVEVGITNASIVEATSMARKLAYEIPIFAGLSYMSAGKSKESNLVFAHIENHKIVPKLVKTLKQNGIDLHKKGVGFIQTIKVDNVVGEFEEDIEL